MLFRSHQVETGQVRPLPRGLAATFGEVDAMVSKPLADEARIGVDEVGHQETAHIGTVERA